MQGRRSTPDRGSAGLKEHTWMRMHFCQQLKACGPHPNGLRVLRPHQRQGRLEMTQSKRLVDGTLYARHITALLHRERQSRVNPPGTKVANRRYGTRELPGNKNLNRNPSNGGRSVYLNSYRAVRLCIILGILPPAVLDHGWGQPIYAVICIGQVARDMRILPRARSCPHTDRVA